MANHSIFFAVCDLFNEGEAIVKMDDAKQVITAAQHTLPDFVVCTGAPTSTELSSA